MTNLGRNRRRISEDGGRGGPAVRRRFFPRGFTLVEVLVASTISGFVALIAVSALNAIASSAQAVHRTTETTSELRFAARLIARDLANLYRDPNPQEMKLVGSSQGNSTGGPPSLCFYMSGRGKARVDQPEGDVYEVEYFLATRDLAGGSQTNNKSGGTTSTSEEGTVLFRRLWPNPDKDKPPGGVLTPIAENIGVFFLRFFDGKQWVDAWTEEMQSLPEYLEVTLAATAPDKGDPLVETMTVTFPRLSKTAAAAAAGATEGQAGAPASGTSPAADSTSGAPGGPGPGGQR